MGTVAWVTSDSGGSKSSGPWYASEPSTAPMAAVGSEQPRGGRRGKRRKVIIAATAGVLAVVAAIVTVIVTVVTPGGSTTGYVPTGNSPDQDAQQITGAFLQAWEAGDLGQAARYTDHPAAAEAALVTFRKYLHLSLIHI